MSITKELYEQLTACGFKFETKKIYQAEGFFIKAEFYFANQNWCIRIPNNEKTTLKDVIVILADKAFELGLGKGIKEGKKEGKKEQENARRKQQYVS